MSKRGRLSRSADFARVYRQGRSHANRWLVLYAFPRAPEGEPRLGLSVSRKVGGAVDRNQVKRRLREAVGRCEGRLAPGTDYVLIARPTTANRPFASLLMDLEEALRQLGQNRAPRRSDVTSGPAAQSGSSEEAPRKAHQPRHQSRAGRGWQVAPRR